MGVGTGLARYVDETGVDGVSCDAATSLEFMARELASRVVVQGNLDPHALVVGGPEMERQTRTILEAMSGRPFIFNLGHGILPHTPRENVARLVKLVREGMH
jgi:uroporphyrinogen decarboxylase